MKIMGSIVRALMCASLLSGCITTEVGGLPKPGTQDQRVKAQIDLARGYLEQRDIGKARKPLENALAIDPTSPEANVLMATVYQVEGELKLAEASYKQAIKYAPRDSMARNNYGTFLYSQGNFDDARKQLLVAVQDPSYSARPQAYENLGLTEIKLGMRADGEQSLQRALMLNGRLPRSMLELAEMSFEDGNFPRSQQYFDGYAKVAKHTARSLWLGVRLSRVFNDENALSSYTLALKNLYPGSEEYRLLEQSSK